MKTKNAKKFSLFLMMLALASFVACENSSSASPEEPTEISSSSDSVDSAAVSSSSSKGVSSSSHKNVSSSSHKNVSSSSELASVESSSSSAVLDSTQIIIQQILGKCDSSNDGELKTFEPFGFPIVAACKDGMWTADSAATMERYSCDEEGAIDSLNIFGADVTVVCENGYWSTDSSKVLAAFECSEEEEGEWFTRISFGYEIDMVCRNGKLVSEIKPCTEGETKVSELGMLKVEMVCKDSKWMPKEDAECTAENIGEEAVVWGGQLSVCTETGWKAKRPECTAETEGETWETVVYGMEITQVCKDGEWQNESVKVCEDGETRDVSIGNFSARQVCVNGMWETASEP
ncbi:MAG: hypothetical protein J6Z31_00585 [Fibrobacter sp.]|nr:hypothetical protein [Fibrobacter sp.]